MINSGDGFDNEKPGELRLKEDLDLDLLNKKIAEALSREMDSEASRIERLGIEARSILKSIETETVKLKQFEVMSRTDRHYFRARFNYYKLSILRLRSEERDFLEPRLVSFYQEICQREIEGGNDPTDLPRPTAILEPVPTAPKAVERPLSVSSKGDLLPSLEASPTPKDLKVTVQELQLIRMALQAEPSKTGQQMISAALDRVISQLETHS